MRKSKVSEIWIQAFLLAVVMAGCSDADKNPGAGNPGAPLTAPTVTWVLRSGAWIAPRISW